VAPAKGSKVVVSDDGAMGPPRIPSNKNCKTIIKYGGPTLQKSKRCFFHFQQISRKVTFADQIGRKNCER
jgi:hypothetical protein